mgnify:CR=1 FL=1
MPSGFQDWNRKTLYCPHEWFPGAGNIIRILSRTGRKPGRPGWILLLSLTSCVILDKLFNFLGLSFLLCAMGTIIAAIQRNYYRVVTRFKYIFMLTYFSLCPLPWSEPIISWPDKYNSFLTSRSLLEPSPVHCPHSKHSVPLKIQIRSCHPVA